METPAEDMELRQDGNSENTTSCGTHINVLTTDNKDHPERQAGKEATTTSQAEEVLSRIKELRKQVTEGQPFLTEGEDTTAPCSSGNCEEDIAGQLLGKISLPVELKKKTADLKQDRSNVHSQNMNQYSNATTDDMADQG